MSFLRIVSSPSVTLSIGLFAFKLMVGIMLDEEFLIKFCAISPTSRVSLLGVVLGIVLGNLWGK